MNCETTGVCQKQFCGGRRIQKPASRTTEHFSFNIGDALLPTTAFVVVPELHLKHFARHALGFFGRVILANSGKDEYAFGYLRDKLPIDGDGSGFHALDDGWEFALAMGVVWGGNAVYWLTFHRETLLPGG